MKTQVPVVWLLANLFHPLLLITWFGVWDFGISGDDIGIVLMLFIYGFLFSMPSLLLGFLVEYLVKIPCAFKPYEHLPIFRFVNNLSGQLVAEMNSFPAMQTSCRPGKRFPVAVCRFAHEK